MAVSVITNSEVKPVPVLKRYLSIERSIELYDYYGYKMSTATTDQQKADAKAIISGVTNPLDYNDPDLNAKIEDYFSKTRPGCLANGAVCYAQFIQCLKDTNYSDECGITYANCTWLCTWPF